MTVKLLTEQHLEVLSLTGACTVLSKSVHVKMLHFWKPRVAAYMLVRIKCMRAYVRARANNGAQLPACLQTDRQADRHLRMHACTHALTHARTHTHR